MEPKEQEGQQPRCTLSDIPVDAPYLGKGPLYEWNAEAAAWVSFRGARLGGLSEVGG
jgi:hypothetical protein